MIGSAEIVRGAVEPIPVPVTTTDHREGAPVGTTVTSCLISRDGSPLEAPEGWLEQVGIGLFWFHPLGTDTGTLGPWIVEVQAVGCDPSVVRGEVVAKRGARNIVQGGPTGTATILIVLAADHVTGALGIDPAIEIDLVGIGWQPIEGNVWEVGGGVYAFAVEGRDKGAPGWRAVRATAPGCDEATDAFYVLPDSDHAGGYYTPYYFNPDYFAPDYWPMMTPIGDEVYSPMMARVRADLVAQGIVEAIEATGEFAEVILCTNEDDVEVGADRNPVCWVWSVNTRERTLSNTADRTDIELLGRIEISIHVRDEDHRRRAHRAWYLDSVIRNAISGESFALEIFPEWTTIEGTAVDPLYAGEVCCLRLRVAWGTAVGDHMQHDVSRAWF